MNRMRTLPCGWHILPTPPHPNDILKHGLRERMVLIKPDQGEFAMVWRDLWRTALRFAICTGHVHPSHRAPIYVWSDDAE